MGKGRTSSLPIMLLAFIISVPILTILAAWLMPSGQGFSYVVEHGLLIDYTVNSLIIACVTAILSFFIGTLTAWYVTMWHFPGKKIFSWGLLLPLAMPAYVVAMIYGHLLEGAGPVQTTLRNISGWTFRQYYFPNIRSISGVIMVLTVTLYPYCYLLARTAFMSQSREMLESGEMLGLTKRQLLMRVTLPLSRPALMVGVALVLMEALADYGVVSLYGVPTFTTGIYRLWQDFYDPFAAAKVASILLLFVFLILYLERRARKHAQYYNQNPHPSLHLWVPSTIAGLGMSFLCLMPILLGFILPLGMLCYFSIQHLEVFADSATWDALINALIIGSLTAFIAVIIGLLFAYQLRQYANCMVTSLIRLATSGYAIPGAIIAVGTLLCLITVQNDLLGGEIFITGTIIGIVWACVMRFLTISFNASEAALTRITPAMDEAACLLGRNRFAIMRSIHFPMLKASLFSSFLIIFIDTVKELPATLLLRPFNFDTLAIRTYELASDDLLPHASATALLLVFISLIPIALLTRRLSKPSINGRYS